MYINMVRLRVMVGTMGMTTTVMMTMSMTMSVAMSVAVISETRVSIVTLFSIDHFVNSLFLVGLTSVLFVFVFLTANLLHNVARALNNFIIFVALDHADVVIIAFMAMLVLVAIVEMAAILFFDDTLAFNIGIVDDWWHVHTSGVENTVDLVLPDAIAVIAFGCKTDQLFDRSTTVTMTMMVMSMVAL